MTNTIVSETDVVNGEPSFRLVLVTPETAERWLERNHSNRKVRPHHVASLASDMESGLWQITGEAIKFDTIGRLIDGQHRLNAIVKSGVTLHLPVVTGLPADSQQVMDSGAKRSAADALGFSGYQQRTTLASAARLSVALRDGAFRSAVTTAPSVTHSQIVKFVELHPEIHDAIHVTNGWRVVGMSHGAAAAAALRLRAIDQVAADQFITDILESRTAGRGDPRRALIHRLQTAKSRRETLRQSSEMWCIFRAWNAVRTGEQLKLIKFNGQTGWVDPR